MAYIWYKRVWHAYNTQFSCAYDTKCIGVHRIRSFCVSIPRVFIFIWRTIYTHFHKIVLVFNVSFKILWVVSHKSVFYEAYEEKGSLCLWKVFWMNLQTNNVYFLIYSRTMLIQENIVFLKSWDTWPDRCSHSALAQLTFRQALASKPTGSKSKQTLCAFQHTHTQRERERELQLLWNFHIGLYPLPKQPLSLFPNLNPHWAVGRSQAHKKMPLTHTCL